MVEGARLESVYTGNRIAGSNPALSASLKNTIQINTLRVVKHIYVTLRCYTWAIRLGKQAIVIIQKFRTMTVAQACCTLVSHIGKNAIRLDSGGGVRSGHFVILCPTM